MLRDDGDGHLVWLVSLKNSSNPIHHFLATTDIVVGLTNQGWNYDYTDVGGLTRIEFLDADARAIVLQATDVVVESCDLVLKYDLNDSTHPSSIKVLRLPDHTEFTLNMLTSSNWRFYTLVNGCTEIECQTAYPHDASDCWSGCASVSASGHGKCTMRVVLLEVVLDPGGSGSSGGDRNKAKLIGTRYQLRAGG